MDSLLQRFRAHVREAGLFPEPGTALVAVSGGPDSVALLDLLHPLARELGLSLVVAHADHGIAAASGVVAEVVGALAARFGLPCERGTLVLGPDTTETLARRARYAWLRDVRRRVGARYVVLGHHRDDQVETILMRALKGSGPAGLAAMAPIARSGLVRPLLPFSKAELVEHARARGLATHDDPANRDPRHVRSWLRTTLVPLLLERLGPRVRDDLVRVGRAAAFERRAWDALLDELPDLALRRVRRGCDVARAGLARYDDAVSVTLVQATARRVGLVLGIRAARQVVALARRPSGRRLALGRGGWIAEAAFDRLRLIRPRAATPAHPVAVGQGHTVFGEFRVAWAPDAAPARVPRTEWTTWISGANWEVRSPRAGDRVLPLGGVGRRPLRRLFMEARVPRTDRASYPVVARGATILWVPGVCRSAADLPPPGTPAVRVDVTKRSEPEADRRA